MISPRAFWHSTIGKKVVMAATGIIMIGFLISHMLGNLLVFGGSQKINAYSAFLHSTGELLWVARIGLLIAVILHIIAAVQLTRRDYAARPDKYAHRRQPQVSTLAARTMRLGGLVLLLFIPFHLLHFTTGTIQPTPFSNADVYANVVGSFRIWWVVLIYVVSMVALGGHLYHGAWSSARTLGLSQASAQPLRRSVSAIIAVLVWLGFTAIPVAIFLGLVR